MQNQAPKIISERLGTEFGAQKRHGTGVETDKYKLFFPVENAWSEDGDLFLAGTFPNYKYSYVVYIFGSGESFERLGANPKNSVCDKFRVKKRPKWLHWNSYYKNTPKLREDPFYMFDRFSSDVESVGVLKFNGGRQYINRAKPGIKPSKWTQDSIDRGETIEIDFDYCFALYTVIESIKKPDP